MQYFSNLALPGHYPPFPQPYCPAEGEEKKNVGFAPTAKLLGQVFFHALVSFQSPIKKKKTSYEFKIHLLPIFSKNCKTMIFRTRHVLGVFLKKRKPEIRQRRPGSILSFTYSF